MEKPFIKVKLHSDVGGVALGQKDLVIYYECDPSIKDFYDSDILSYDDELLKWVNTRNRFQKGDFNKDFEFHTQPFQLIFLNDEQIKRVREAGRVVRKEDLISFKNRW